MVSHRLLGVLVAVAAFFASAAVAHAASPGLNGKIAFSEYNPNSSAEDIFVVQPDGTGETAIVVPGIEQNPVWSPDGAKIAFVRNADIHVMNADGSGLVNLTPGTFSSENSPTWSPDGSQIAFSSSREAALGFKIFRMDAADGSDVARITDGVLADGEPDWSPSGLRIAFVRSGDIYTIKPDGSDLQLVIAGSRPLRQVDWSPSGHRIVYQHPGDSPSTTGIHTVEPDGSNDVDLTSFLTAAHEPVWSPDGTKILAKKGLHLWTMSPDGSGAAQLTTTAGNHFTPDWQPIPYTGYPRPKGATPVRVPLVPAFTPCTSPDRTHGPPLSFGSCSSPSQVSPYVMVGTPDANGVAANSEGFVLIRVVVGAPGPPDDSGAPIEVRVSDVRCNAGASPCGPPNSIVIGDDYAGELQLELQLQVTDKDNAVAPGGGPDPATGSVAFPVTVGCAATASTAIGALCSVVTDANAVVPGSVKDGKRAIWELGQVRVLDGGSDGDVDTPGNSVFAVQGLFVP